MIDLINLEQPCRYAKPESWFDVTGPWDLSRLLSATGVRGSRASVDQFVIEKTYDLNQWSRKLDKMERLEEGWNGYSAPAPSALAIRTARRFLSRLLAEPYEPTRVAPSSVGGVGFTHKKGNRRVYVEFFNDGQVYALFSDNEIAPRSQRVQPDFHQFRELIGQIKGYLDA